MPNQSVVLSNREYELLSIGLRCAIELLDSMNSCKTLAFWQSIDFDQLGGRLKQDLPEISAEISDRGLSEHFWQLIREHARAMDCIEDVIWRMSSAAENSIFADAPSHAMQLQRMANYLYSVSPDVLDRFVNPGTEAWDEYYDEEDDEDQEDWITYGDEDEDISPLALEDRSSRVLEGVSETLKMLSRHRRSSNGFGQQQPTENSSVESFKESTSGQRS
jgi:hypothetical protein